MKYILLLFSVAILASCQPEIAEVVNVEGGQIEGYTKDNLHIYKGIPFAAPPVGDLRWKEPQPLESWDGIKETKAFSASPFQNDPQPFYCWSKEFIAPPEPLSEDCLYLNVWTGAKNTDEKRPVFVWIYGGGFNSGSTACDIYDGEEYAKDGVVFVSLNYRVGPLGFMSHPELTEEQGGHSGNYGLLDQVAGLKWVQENIEAFGGDPENVTIGGQSAGSMAVHALMASPLAKGLFNKAIAMSGGYGAALRTFAQADADALGVQLQEGLGAENLADMRSMSSEQIQEAVSKVQGRFALVTDGYMLPEGAYENKASVVPVLTGWTKDDGGFLAGPQMTLEQYTSNIKERYSENADEYLTVFNAETDEDAAKMQTRISTLGFAGVPARKLALSSSEPVFVYEVAHVPTDKPDFPHYGAFHTSDVPYALRNLHTWDRPWQEHDMKVQEVLSSYYLNFIKTGNPNAEGLPEWKNYTEDNGYVQVVDNVIAGRENYYAKEFELLTK